MIAQQLVADLRARGVSLYRLGERVRVIPASAVEPDLQARLRAHRAELLRILPDAPPAVAVLRPAERRSPPTPNLTGDATDELFIGGCPSCGAPLPSPRVVALCATCRRVANPDATTFAPDGAQCSACGERDRWRAVSTGLGSSRAPWVCTTCHPPAPGITTERAIGTTQPEHPLTVASDPLDESVPAERRRAIDADLALLRVIVERYSRARDDEREQATAMVLGERIGDLLDRLDRLGARVRLVTVH